MVDVINDEKKTSHFVMKRPVFLIAVLMVRILLGDADDVPQY